jgi:hypothetical protein
VTAKTFIRKNRPDIPVEIRRLGGDVRQHAEEQNCGGDDVSAGPHGVTKKILGDSGRSGFFAGGGQKILKCRIRRWVNRTQDSPAPSLRVGGMEASMIERNQ